MRPIALSPAALSLAAMSPTATSRRLVLRTLVAAFSLRPALPGLAVPPPAGSVMLLLPMVQQRLLLAECSAAITTSNVSWPALRVLFTGPQFTDPRRAEAVGSMFRNAASEYEASLLYSKELSADDRKLCFPRSDAECIRLQTDSDRLYRTLLVNDALSALQAVEEELGYLSKCEGGYRLEAGARCPAADDREEITRLLGVAELAVDAYLDVVPASDVRAAVSTVARTSPRWQIVPIDSETAEGRGDGSAAPRTPSPTMQLAASSDSDSPDYARRSSVATGTLVRFALPALAAWLVSPLMSLIDTAVVGRYTDPTALAALGPATMVGDSMSYLCSFLSVATTNLIATALASGGGADEPTSSVTSSASTRETLVATYGTAARLAVLLGAMSTLAQLAFGRAILTRYTAARSAACVAPAFEYVRVRAFGAPLSLLARVSTATCIAAKDSLTPLYAVGASGLLNLILDVVLVSMLHCGIGGAAWATVVSEAVCAAIVIRAVRSKLQPGRLEPSTMGDARSRRPPLLPSRAAVNEYAAFAPPLLLTLAGKIATYSALAHVATTVSVASTAAHRVLMCVYWFTWPFAEVISQVGQAFLPGASSESRGPLMRKLVSGGMLVGLACAAGSAGVLAVLPSLFSTDAAVVATIRSLVPLVAMCIATLAAMCSMEGALLASRQLDFLSTFYAANALAMVAAFALVERAGFGLRGAWSCMLAFQCFRLAAFGTQLWRGHRREPM